MPLLVPAGSTARALVLSVKQQQPLPSLLHLRPVVFIIAAAQSRHVHGDVHSASRPPFVFVSSVERKRETGGSRVEVKAEVSFAFAVWRRRRRRRTWQDAWSCHCIQNTREGNTRPICLTLPSSYLRLRGENLTIRSGPRRMESGPHQEIIHHNSMK